MLGVRVLEGGVQEARERTYILTFAEFLTQVKTGFSARLPYSR